MSNVNPGRYTQRGRLTQDDAAREIARQRSIGSQHTWQPVKKNTLPRIPSNDEDADEGGETSDATESLAARSDVGRVPRSRPGATGKAKTSAVKKTSDVGRVPRLVRHSLGEGGSVPGAAGKTTATRTVRQAVLARNTGGGALKPVRAAKRRKG